MQKQVDTRTESDEAGSDISSSMPIVTSRDAAEYLAEILPQLAIMANKSGLPEIGNMMELATSFAQKAKTNS